MSQHTDRQTARQTDIDTHTRTHTDTQTHTCTTHTYPISKKICLYCARTFINGCKCPLTGGIPIASKLYTLNIRSFHEPLNPKKQHATMTTCTKLPADHFRSKISFQLFNGSCKIYSLCYNVTFCYSMHIKYCAKLIESYICVLHVCYQLPLFVFL